MWLLFALLVALKIHGSSLNQAAFFWRPEGPAQGESDYLFEPLVNFARDKLGEKKYALPKLPEFYGQLSRSDEYKVGTPYALAQCAHTPPCPVINSNIGLGQNMLPIHCAPVWHVAALSRPATWGYLLFGAEHGLAWYWWFQPFASFSAVFLLLEILLSGRAPEELEQRRIAQLAAFGAFWCTGSAYMLCWSNVPSYFVFFPAGACVAAYRLLSANTLRVQVVSAVALGLLVPGFVMLLYPPWQVSLGYVFLFLFAGLCVRDGLARRFLEARRAGLLALAVLLAGLLGGAFFYSALPALKTLSATEFPGKREYSGGGIPVWQLFRGWFDFWSTHQIFDIHGNVSEASSFYHFYPAVLCAALFSKRVRAGLSWPGVALLGSIGLFVFVMNRGIPEWLARATFLSYLLPKRGDIAVGVASILVSVQTLSALARPDASALPTRLERWMPILSGVALALVLAAAGAFTIKFTNYMLDPHVVFAVVLGGGWLGYCLAAGRTGAFCGTLTMLLLATSALFNPLVRGVSPILNSEMARAIGEIVRRSDPADASKPLWLCYGEQHPGVVVTMLNGRSISGVQYVPQLELWHLLDPERKSESIYNRYAHVGLLLNPAESDPAKADFYAPAIDSLVVRASPFNPALKSLGARYVLVYGSEQKNFETLPLKLLHKGVNGIFSIYEIPGTGTQK